MTPVYYNEIDPFAAAWLRTLIAAGDLPAGDVDERSITVVRPDDLVPYRHCHFFAGIGGWPYALRLAGWPADRPVWTGSCPCQPFSAAGRGHGAADPRDLWPAWRNLIGERRPPTIFGEQVADALNWLDRVYVDLEGAGYAVGTVDLPACSVGAFHIRQRLWIVAERMANASGVDRAGDAGDETRTTCETHSGGETKGRGDVQSAYASNARVLADAGYGSRRRGDAGVSGASPCVGPQDDDPLSDGRAIRGMADADRARTRYHDAGGVGTAKQDIESSQSKFRRETKAALDGRTTCGMGERERARLERLPGDGNDEDQSGRDEPGAARSITATSPSHGAWCDVEWIPCRDGRARPTQPGLCPLAHGVPARVGRLRGYGNAIVPPLAAAFIRAYLDVTEDDHGRPDLCESPA